MFIAGFKFFFGIIAGLVILYLAIFFFCWVAELIEQLIKGIKDEIDKIHTDKE